LRISRRVVVLASCTLGLALGFSNIAFLGFGLFVIPLSMAYGWSRSQISFGFTIMTATVIVVTPLIGGLIDRYGVRRILLPSVILFSVAFASLGLLGGRLWQFYATYALLAVFGAGTLGGSYSRVLIGWFDARRGLALGIALAGIGIGGMIIPPFVHALLARGGLVAAYAGVGAIVMFVSFPTAALFIEERVRGTQPSAEPDVLIRDRHFYNFVPLLVDRGIASSQATWVMSTLAAALVIGRVVAGYLLDRIYPPLVVSAFLAGPVLGLTLLAGGATGSAAFGCAILLGLGMGAEFDFMSYLVSRYLAPTHFARNYGSIYSAFSLGASIGPIILALSLQRTGSYSPALWLLAALVVVTIVLCMSLGGPRWPAATGAAAP
jgi:MFS family permease